MKKIILLLFAGLFCFQISAQVNISKEECELVFTEAGTGDELDRMDITHLKFDSSGRTHLWFKDDYNKNRHSLKIYNLDSLEYLGVLDTITDVATALAVTGNTLAAHTVITAWVNECKFKTFDPGYMFMGAGSPEGVVAAPLGAIYINTLGGANVGIYIKEADDWLATGWAGK